jgi:hypothetical protein
MPDHCALPSSRLVAAAVYQLASCCHDCRTPTKMPPKSCSCRHTALPSTPHDRHASKYCSDKQLLPCTCIWGTSPASYPAVQVQWWSGRSLRGRLLVQEPAAGGAQHLQSHKSAVVHSAGYGEHRSRAMRGCWLLFDASVCYEPRAPGMM